MGARPPVPTDDRTGGLAKRVSCQGSDEPFDGRARSWILSIVVFVGTGLMTWIEVGADTSRSVGVLTSATIAFPAGMIAFISVYASLHRLVR